MLRRPAPSSLSALLKCRVSLTFRFFSTRLPSQKELYEQTNCRWLYNEAEQQEIRRVNFNVTELINAATVAAGVGPCLSMQKIAEGSSNKIFRLQFDNSHSIIARIPSSRMFGSGVSYIVASEVATMTAVSDKLNIRTPRIIAWNKESDISKNPVGWPYILMEDVDGVPLGREWLTGEMRGNPVATLLNELVNDLHKMTDVPFTQLGSLYFPEDIPSVPPPAAPKYLETQVRVGPIADLKWWRPYHDEPDMDRGPWDTLEDCIKAAVRLERRAVERHREDPSSLSCTNSSLDDLTEIELLLDKVEALAPHLQTAIEKVSPFPDEFMQNVLIHPDIQAHNIMVQKLSADKKNRVSRMIDPVFIDWQGACVLPWALQFSVPPLVEYEPRMLDRNGQPLLEVDRFEEVQWPEAFEFYDSEVQKAIRAEHSIATRNVRWVKALRAKKSSYAHILTLPIQYSFCGLFQGILHSCANGPHFLRLVLISIKELWDEESENFGGPCPYTFTDDELQIYGEKHEQLERFDTALQFLLVRLKCERNGAVLPEDHEKTMKVLARARKEWDEVACGGPFPFDDGRWGPFLR